jgi:hypothetical protein
MTEPAASRSSFPVVAGVLVVLVLVAVFLVMSRRPEPEPPAATAPVPAAGARGAAAGQAAPGAAQPGQPAQPGAGAAGGESTQGAEPGGGVGTAGGVPLPRDARGTAGAPPALSAQAMMRRSFVPGRSSVENRKGVSDDVSGFDVAGSKGVEVKRAPEISGRIEFSMDPLRVKPGDKYSLRISLVNEGKRTIEIDEVRLRTVVNRKAKTQTVKPRVAEVASRQNEVVYELSGTWDASTTSWSLEASVISKRQDLYTNRVTWK